MLLLCGYLYGFVTMTIFFNAFCTSVSNQLNGEVTAWSTPTLLSHENCDLIPTDFEYKKNTTSGQLSPQMNLASLFSLH